MQRTVVITGCSGFIGSAMAQFFIEKQWQVKGLMRSTVSTQKPGKKQIVPILWDGRTLNGWEKELEGAAALINLAGENIGSGRWTAKKKERILSSRLKSTQALIKALEHVQEPPAVLVQASAVGYYGSRQDEELDEHSEPGQGFLAEVVKQWEDSSANLEQLNIRRIITRFGMVLDKNRGVLKQMSLPFKLFVGGPVGSGNQWMSWVHIEDLVRAVEFLLSQPECSGTYNITSPNPVRNKHFAHSLGQVMHRPSFFTVPGFVLKTLFGQMAEELLLAGQQVLPSRLLNAGFEFKYPEIESALNNLFTSK
jgi:uncharacterized protein (TIGR01777 family)